MVTIVDDEGTELAVVSLTDSALECRPSLHVGRIARGNGRLLSYYFNQGRRTVSVIQGDTRLPGVLRTKWLDNTRDWSIEPIAYMGSPEMKHA